jgi:hypothetical protein
MAVANASSNVVPRPPDFNPAAQRALVYSLTGLLVLTSWVVAAAFKDPCAGTPGIMPGMCKPTVAQRLPSMETLGTLLSIQVVMVVLYELRWTLRGPLVAVVGAAMLGVAAYLMSIDKPTLLVVAVSLIGASLVGLEYGIRKGKRAPWAFATVTCGVLTLIFFFASRRIHESLDIPLALAVLPSLGGLLPVTVALATSSPAAPRIPPFGK